MKEIKAIGLDVDGVLTDGTITLFPNGDQIRTMHTRDGYALKRAMKAGIKIFIISGGKSESVRLRLQGLGIEDVYLGVRNKIDTLHEWSEKHGISLDHIGYMGDDLPDCPVLDAIGFPAAPRDACYEVLARSKFISTLDGGKGCVRHWVETILRDRGCWPTLEVEIPSA